MQKFFIYLGGIFILLAITAKGIVETFILSRIFSKGKNNKDEKRKRIIFKVRVFQTIFAMTGAIILFIVMITL
ncbi:hypothetical protein [Sporosalibacterium faouarense]|uniref:hypothetical protein n=1 Tax=Sporosalibacterium faouarense TaxID=516123 RepID=UPI00141C4D9C|nr:hypothetical protein [Sporosalibacterium faouarense]MTI46578.1 hypothetical protein [Bacillota bacterium]